MLSLGDSDWGLKDIAEESEPYLASGVAGGAHDAHISLCGVRSSFQGRY